MTREQFIQGLRTAADLYEKHPEIPAPTSSIDFNGYLWGDNAKEALVSAVRALGKTRKNATGSYVYFERYLVPGDFKISVAIEHEKVCRKVVTVEVVPAKPEVVLPAVPEKTTEKVTWVCDDPILAPVDQASELRELAAAE